MNNAWVFTINETARLLKVNERTVRRLIKAGVVPAVKVGGSVRVPADRLRECLGLKPQDVGTRFDGDKVLCDRCGAKVTADKITVVDIGPFVIPPFGAVKDEMWDICDSCKRGLEQFLKPTFLTGAED